MLTIALAALKGHCCCLPLFQKAEDIESASTDDDLRPLLDRTPPPSSPLMPPLRKYGTKRSTTPAASAAIFGRSPPAASAPIPVSRLAPREPLSELSSNLGALVLDKASVSSEPEYTLHPLLDAFQLPPKSWGSVLSTSDTLEKIAEASYAEVFRCTNTDGTSILKVMQLKVSSDPASLEYTHTSVAETVISELQIMEALTEVPGFVTFKDVHLIKGNPGTQFKQSWEAYSTLYTSQFPHPDYYTCQSVFLVIELGDAGQVLEDLSMEHIEQVWDILLGVIIALARAEDTNDFEHRDLHENNVCIMQTDDLTYIDPIQHGDFKLGFSGLEITLIDYGLSRTTLPEKIAFNDLEQSLELFQGDGTNANENMQYDNYRRMRTYLETGERRPTPVTAKSESIEASGHTWAEYTPYSNVLWIRYLYFYLERNFKKHGVEKTKLKDFQVQTKELKTKLDPRTAVRNGAFASAQEVLLYAVDKGWVSQEQLEERGVDSSFLSEAEA